MKGIVFAFGLGYLVGTLWAPRQGSLLRADIRKHYEELQDGVIQFGQGMKDEAAGRITRAGESITKAGDVAKETFEKLDKNVHDIADKSVNAFS